VVYRLAPETSENGRGAAAPKELPSQTVFPISPDAGPQPRITRWARLVVNIRMPLRRGAWYPAPTAGPEEVVVDVQQHPTIVPRSLVDVSNSAPNRWTLVPKEWGGPYFVCPQCSERVRMRDPVVQLTMLLTCLHCHGVFPIDQLDLTTLRFETPSCDDADSGNSAG